MIHICTNIYAIETMWWEQFCENLNTYLDPDNIQNLVNRLIHNHRTLTNGEEYITTADGVICITSHSIDTLFSWGQSEEGAGFWADIESLGYEENPEGAEQINSILDEFPMRTLDFKPKVRGRML